MRTIEQVLERQPDHLKAADELVRRFSGDQSALREAALQWTGRAAGCRVPAPIGWESPLLDSEKSSHVYQLVEQATVGSEPLHELALRARRPHYFAGRREDGYVYDRALLNLTIWLWPHRGAPDRWPEVVEEWGRLASEPNPTELNISRGRRRGSVGATTVLLTALRVADFPDLAYRMIQPATLDSRLAADHFAVCVGLRRLASKPPHELQDEARVRDFGVRRILRESEDHDRDVEFALHELVGLARNGREPLDWLWQEVEAGLASESEWANAMVVVLAHGPHQDRAVLLLAEAIRGASSALEPLERLVTPRNTLLGVAPFRGPGWGKEGLGKKLLPVTRALMARAVWPVGLFRWCFRPPRDGDGDDFALERMREVLAEGCLGMALDAAEAVDVRRRALDGLERLSPVHESFQRALGKLTSAPAEIRYKGREVQRALGRAPPADAELAVADGCEVLGLEIVRERR